MQDRFMARAIELAMENVRAGRGGPFAAVVVKDGRIVGEGTNRVTYTNDPTAHAEVVAIREACRTLGSFQLTACDIYTTCEPCPMCLGAIYWARPARVFYAATGEDAARFGFDDSFISREMQRPLPKRKIPMMSMMREEALRIFPLWQESPNKIEY